MTVNMIEAGAGAIRQDLEPLLSNADNITLSSNESTVMGKNEKNSWPENLERETRIRLRIGSLATGLYVGLITQAVLDAAMWDRSIMYKSILHVELFSLSWSLLSYLISYLAAKVYFSDMRVWSIYKNSSDESWTTLSSTMEPYIFGGSLISTCGFWLIIDLTKVELPLSTSSLSANVMISTILYLLIMATTNGNMIPVPYWWCPLLSSIMGLAVGFGSQFVLGSMRWNELFPSPHNSSIGLISFIWSTSTVISTFLGCQGLRMFKNSISDKRVAERTFLHVESYYFLGALIGVFFGWMMLDAMSGNDHQTLLSLCLLFFALVMFRTILCCFPEEKCLEEIEIHRMDV